MDLKENRATFLSVNIFPPKQTPFLLDLAVLNVCIAAPKLKSIKYKGSGENKKLPPHRIPTVGIVRKVLSTTNTTIPKHHHHGGAVCPSYGVRLMDLPNLTQVTSSEGVERGCFSLVLYETIK
jgi:hypothetical protein